MSQKNWNFRVRRNMFVLLLSQQKANTYSSNLFKNTFYILGVKFYSENSCDSSQQFFELIPLQNMI